MTNILTNPSDMNAAAQRVAQSIGAGGSRTGAQLATTRTALSTAPKASSQGDITSSDFLNLLVTEMKNQDPTQPTDPNAYIQQLVGVNSLQQLIAINNNLSGLGSSAGLTTSPVEPV